MKKFLQLIAAAAAVLALGACSPSNIKSEESMPIPEDVLEVSKAETTKAKTKKEETKSTYSIPADAPTGVDGGPGMMETQAANFDADYPEDKKANESGSQSGTMICLYELDFAGIVQAFDTVDVCDADSLIAAMVSNNILAMDTKVEAFSAEGGKGVLTLNKLEGVYEKATEEKILACVVNTFVENLSLETLEVKVGDKSYGEMAYTDRYDAT